MTLSDALSTPTAAATDGARPADATPPSPSGGTAAAAEEAAVLGRLDGRIAWYHRRATQSANLFKLFKLATLIAAAAIPLLAGSVATVPLVVAGGLPVTGAAVAAVLGALIVVIEGVQQLFQWQQNWLSYRATAEALEMELALYRARTGDYAGNPAPHRLLAYRTEELMAQERKQWLASRREGGRTAGADEERE